MPSPEERRPQRTHGMTFQKWTSPEKRNGLSLYACQAWGTAYYSTIGHWTYHVIPQFSNVLFSLSSNWMLSRGPSLSLFLLPLFP